MMDQGMKFTGERYVPSEQGEIRLEHLHRYATVLGIVAGKDVLDVACGEGYGSRLISTVARSTTGVDISGEAIEHARAAYRDSRNLEFQVGSATQLPLENASFDVVVSFETIEHLEGQQQMLAEIRRVLRPEGVLVISSPNRPVYSRAGQHRNEFHVKELDFAELDALLKAQFPAVRYFGQRIAAGSLLQPLEGQGKSFAAWSDDGAQVGPHWGTMRDPVYFVALCAAREGLLPGMEASVLQSTQSDLLDNYRQLAEWARLANAEVERVGGLYQALADEHGKVGAWAHSLDAELARRRKEISEAREAQRRLEEEHRRAGALAQSLESQLADVRKDLAEQQESYRKLDEEHARVREWAHSLDADLAFLRKELAGSQDAYRALEDEKRKGEARQTTLEGEVAQLRQQLEGRQGEIQALGAEVSRRVEMHASLEAQVAALRSSFSWRITAPLRFVVGALAAAWRGTRHAVITGPQWFAGVLFNWMPISSFARHRIRGFVYANLPVIAEGSPPYEQWKARRPYLKLLAQALGRLSEGPEAKLIGPDSTRVPKASIIVPIYGQVDYTMRCLQGIIESQINVPFEILVVDDCSPDVSVELLVHLPAIRLLGASANQGFIRTCNRGAKEARGEFVVFLNNDTIVQPGWLDALVQTFEDFPECGLAGSKLLYPDGRLQEAGGILWNDGSGWNYGRLDDPNKPEYCYLRDVDYCSGASIMLRSGLFQKLGGFDEHYVPAYAEDSDLAFRVRKAGYRVLYQPMSKVVHFEGITSGTDVTQGVKAHQVANAKKLFERWRETLAGHGEPGANPHLVRDRNIAGRVLVIDHCTPTPDQDAGSITAFNLMRIIQGAGMKVTFVPEDNMLYMERYTTDLQRLGIECLYYPHVPNLKTHLAEYGHIYDVVIFFRVGNATRHLDDIEFYCRQAKIVYHTSDVHFLRIERQADVENSEKLRQDAAILKDRELAAMRRTHATIVHSSLEKQMLDEMLGWTDQSRIFVLGWSIPIPGTSKGFADRDGMVFVGGYQHGPNVDAVDYFVREVFPLVRAHLPAARFLIVGSKAPDRFRNLGVDGVEFVGFVEELGPLLDQCRLSVAPLRYGAGTKGKVYTSLSHGLPCVATSIGAEGMNLVHDKDVLVADQAMDFAAQVVRVHEDEALWNRLSQNGYKFLQAHASLDVGKDVVNSIFRHLGIDDRKRRTLVPAAGPAKAAEIIVADREQFDAFMKSELARKQLLFEDRIIRKHSGSQDEYDLEGWCELCATRTAFHVDKLWGGQPRDGKFWEPNWRERCLCIRCHMGTRHRAVAARVRDHIASLQGQPIRVYLTEQVTPLFEWLRRNVSGPDFVGSEYLGPSRPGGWTDAAGVRHENVEALSFGDESFDLVVSNDVLEHVNDPEKALAELLRILRPGGVLIMTVPFHTALERNRRRAEIIAGSVVNHLPEVRHGSPVAEEAPLVFTDFGWELMEQIKYAGFVDVAMHLYWDEWRGYMGVGDHYIRATKPGRSYDQRVERELQTYRDTEVVHDLPQIFHYWSHNHLRPIFEDAGIASIEAFFGDNLHAAAQRTGSAAPRFLSIGSGNCDTEVSVALALRAMGLKDFVLECMELNEDMLLRGKGHAESRGVAGNLAFTRGDFNSWTASARYDGIMANQSLHHVLNLEGLFSQVKAGLHEKGYFVVSDIIGRNGHMRWPEALRIVHELWRELPESHKYNHALKRFENPYENWDCASEGFEGIRAQDVLPLLLQSFHFKTFVAFGNVIDIFTDRGFGPNFKPDDPRDRAFIDNVHRIDEDGIAKGTLTPTHMIAVLSKEPVADPFFSRGLRPEACVRKP